MWRKAARADRPSNVTLYTDSYGTLPAFHYHKYCRNHKKGCSVVQYYGYHTNGLFQLHFDDDWEENKYFVSSQETAFELQLVSKFDVELLIGQVSYKQRAEMYNAIHNYEDVKKRCSMNEDNESNASDEEDL
jgi:hypothetical protein